MMKKIVLGLMLPLFAQCAVAQTMDSIDCDFWWPDDEQVMWGVPEQMPNFPGGETALMKYISEHLVYPQEAKDAGVEGRVFVGVVVTEDGSLACFKVLKGLGYGCDEAALEVFEGMPNWMPAMQRGKTICYPYVVPVFFGHKQEIVEQELITVVENMPEYPGGFDAMLDFINGNLEYPQEAKDAEIEGKVFVSFIVEKDGSLSSIKLLRGIGYGCDEAAMDVVRKMPKWKPAIQRGKPVRVQYQLPFNFKLENEKTEITMAKGKQTCKILKEIRKQIAAENDIEFVTSECTHKGDCLGTCPKCEAEVRYLERELEKRQRMGKAAVFAGMSLGTLFAATSCDHPILEPLAGDVPYIPDSTEMPNDSISNDTLPADAFLLEGDVLAPESDTMKAEKKKATCKNEELLAIVGEIVEINDEEVVNEEGVTEGYVAPEMGEIEDPETVIYQIVEEMPAFPGGEAKLFEFISKNIHYPQEAKEKGIQGRAFVGFVIEKDGSVSNVRNLRGVDSELDAEAIRVIESMPKWKPGMHRGEPVRVSYQLPIWFKLEDSKE